MVLQAHKNKTIDIRNEKSWGMGIRRKGKRTWENPWGIGKNC